MKEYKKPKKHEQYLSSNPYGHRVESTPPKTARGARWSTPAEGNERWMDDMRIDVFNTRMRHHHTYFRQSIENHNDTVRRHYQEERKVFGCLLEDLF